MSEAESAGGGGLALVRRSKLLAKILRHDPGSVGLELDPAGWVEVDALLGALAAEGEPMTREELERVVRESDERRFALVDGRIRANHGHSVPVELDLEPAEPPSVLYHGTSDRTIGDVLREGIRPGRRLQVHLSPDVETARTVGGRHGRPVVLHVDARRMAADGFRFFPTPGGVWLVDAVPPAYLSAHRES